MDTVPANAAEIARYPDILPVDRRIYVGQPPGTTLAQVVALIETLHRSGYRPVPQIAAREIQSETELREALDRLRTVDVQEALIVAGDRAGAAGPFDSSLALLGTGLLAANGITTVGVAGYPEGNRLVGPTVLAQAMRDKVELAEACGWQLYIVTQLSFDPAAVIEWIERDPRRGTSIPVHIGLPGIGSMRDLIAYSQRCGIGASMRMLVAKSSSLPDAAALSTTSELAGAYARWLARRPDLSGIHARFFTFAGLEQTVRWVEQIEAGRFELLGFADAPTPPA